jgi:uncharacterized protein (DUF1810 family)
MSFNATLFIHAQDLLWYKVTQELTQGRKTSHWMWFVFPQLRGLGKSAEAEKYGLAGIEKAQAYWNHDILGPRLHTLLQILLDSKENQPIEIFGFPDSRKFSSCLTLFSLVDNSNDQLFKKCLDKFYAGVILTERKKIN